MILRTKTGLVAFAAALAAGCGVSEATGPTLRFTAIPDNNTTELRAKFEPLAAYLSQALDVPVEYVPTSKYSASVEAFKNGDVLLAWFGGLTGVQARATVAGARAIAQGKVDPRFKSYFIAHSSTGLSRSQAFPMGLEGRNFTFGSQSSTSGRLMPEHFIRLNTQRSPEQFFGHDNSYAGSHDQAALLVQAGTFDAGVLNYKVYEELVQACKIDPEVCRIVWETPEYPDYNWTAHPALENHFGIGFTDRLQASLLAMTAPELLRAVQRPEGLIEAADGDFEVIRSVASDLGFLPR